MKKFLFIPLLLFVFTCNQKVGKKTVNASLDPDYNKTLTTVSFGSCNNQNKSQDMWQYIIANKPDLWIWLGDNVYADTEDMKVMKEKYDKQKSNSEYQKLLQSCPVLGIWDDHDYGENDAGKHYPKKMESKKLMLDFLDVDKSEAVRKKHTGAYQSYSFGKEGKKVKIILLDARYFRDDLVKDEAPGRRYKANMDGDILGEEQWQWLEKELSESDAQVHIIGSGIQFIPEDHGWEKWANFPTARNRFFRLIAQTKIKHPVLISGDRHIAEFSKYQIEDLDYPVYELTSSGLTHTWSKPGSEKNQHRSGELIIKRNFGLLHIDWQSGQPILTAEIKGLNNESFLKQRLEY